MSVFASGAQRVNHLDESYGGRTPDIPDNAYGIVEYPSGARAMLDLCMFAENSVDNEHITVVGDEGKLESLLPSMTLRYGRREDWGTRKCGARRPAAARDGDALIAEITAAGHAAPYYEACDVRDIPALQALLARVGARRMRRGEC